MPEAFGSCVDGKYRGTKKKMYPYVGILSHFGLFRGANRTCTPLHPISLLEHSPAYTVAPRNSHIEFQEALGPVDRISRSKVSQVMTLAPRSAVRGCGPVFQSCANAASAAFCGQLVPLVRPRGSVIGQVSG
jgi:hypothetical protein